MLFSLFLEYLETHLHKNWSADIKIDQMNIFLLLFADDSAIISETLNDLQKHLNTLHTNVHIMKDGASQSISVKLRL